MPVAMNALIPPSLFRLDLDLANACWVFTTLELVLVLPILIIILPAAVGGSTVLPPQYPGREYSPCLRVQRDFASPRIYPEEDFMNRLFRTALMAAVCVGLLSAPAFAAYKKEYKLSVVPAATSGWGLSATYFADLVKERTNGRINIKVYPGAQLMAGKQTSELLLVRRGAIDFALASTINWSPQVQELNLTALPFFVANNPDRYKAMDAIEAGESGKMLVAAVEKTGVKFHRLGRKRLPRTYHQQGPHQSSFRHEGHEAARVRHAHLADIFTALGANPQAINWSEAVTGFQQGIVDGQENPT